MRIWILLFILCSVSALGQDVAKTPPMGWNSYDCFGYAVNEKEVKENADFMAKHLKQFGWEYVVVDYVWSCPRGGPGNAPDQSAKFVPPLNMDSFGRLLPDTDRFPSSIDGKGFKFLANYIHRKGLKFGIHVMRGIPRQAVAQNCRVFHSDAYAGDVADRVNVCSWLNHMYGLNMAHPGAQAYLDSILKLYASWGVDFIKVDDLSNPYAKPEIEGYRRAISRCGRPIVLSMSPGPTPLEYADHAKQNANMWRLLGDLWDHWDQVDSAFDICSAWNPYSGPGHWPDPDMLPLGKLRKYGPSTGPPDTYSALTHDEEITLLSLWCISRSPLMFGGHLPETDSFTLTLITDAEALDVDQHSWHNRPLKRGDYTVWVANAQASPDIYLAVFNRTKTGPTSIPIQLRDIGVKRCAVRDLWAQKDVGYFNEVFEPTINAHGAGLYKLTVQESAPVTPPPPVKQP